MKSLELRRLVAGLSHHRQRFDHRPVTAGFVVHEVATGQVFSKYFSVSLSVSLHQCSILIFHSPTTDATYIVILTTDSRALLCPSFHLPLTPDAGG